MEPPRHKLSWLQLEEIARSLPRKTNLVVPREAVPDVPPYQRSRLGRPRGALRQFRCDNRSKNLHVKEYHDRWVVHVDYWNPHTNPVRHLLVDHGYKAFVHLFHVLEISNPAPTPTPVPAAAE